MTTYQHRKYLQLRCTYGGWEVNKKFLQYKAIVSNTEKCGEELYDTMCSENVNKVYKCNLKMRKISIMKANNCIRMCSLCIQEE